MSALNHILLASGVRPLAIAAAIMMPAA